MHAKNSPLFRAGLLAGAALALTTTRAAAVDANADAFPTFESYIKITGQAASVTGNGAAYQTRTRQPENGGAGIEDLHYTRDLSKVTSLQFDGRALAGVEDYLMQLKLSKQETGSVEVGYKRFRTFYDGIGGFFPINQAWFALANQDLHTDRGRFWAEAKLALKDRPVFTLRYTNETRSGTKDSTIWADSNLTGLPTVPTNNAVRKVAPAFRTLGERHELLEGGVVHTVGNTTVNLRLLGDWVNNNDALYYNKLAPNAGRNDPVGPERDFYQRDALTTKSTTAMATTETIFTEKITVNTGLSYTHLTSQVGGERPNAIGALPTYDFRDLAGGSKITTYAANAALIWRPVPNWMVQPAVRIEDTYTKSASTFNRVTGTVIAPVSAFYNANERIKEQIVTPDLSVRYTGFKNVVIYATANDRINRGDERRNDQYATLVPTTAQIWSMDVNQDQSHYTLGSNWNVSNQLILRGEVFHKDHENKFIGYDTKIGDRYVIGYQFTGYKLTAIVKPVPELSFTTRYLPQTGKMQVTTEATPEFQSMDAKSHLIGETIDWNPNKAIFVQANFNVAFNTISSAYPSAANPNQRNSDNNYWTGSLITGAVLGKHTDGTLEYTYQKADNFLPALAQYTQPYGAGYEQSSVTLGVKHRFSDRWIGHAKAGYIDSKNDTTGGNTNFRGPLAYVSFEHSL